MTNKPKPEYKQPNAAAVGGVFLVVAFLIWGWAVLAMNWFAVIMLPIMFILGALVVVYGEKAETGKFPLKSLKGERRD